MKDFSLSNGLMLTCMVSSVLLTGCGASASKYRPIVDGPKKITYVSDLEDCQQLSRQREYLNDDVKSEAALGAVLGVLYEGMYSAEDALAGALLGGALGGLSAMWNTRYERKDIVVTCMSNRGHKVVG